MQISTVGGFSSAFNFALDDPARKLTPYMVALNAFNNAIAVDDQAVLNFLGMLYQAMRNLPSDMSSGDGTASSLYEQFCSKNNYPISVDLRSYNGDVEGLRKALRKGYLEMSLLSIKRLYKTRNMAGAAESTTERTLRSAGEVLEVIRKKMSVDLRCWVLSDPNQHRRQHQSERYARSSPTA